MTRLYIADTGDLSVVIYDGISTKNGNIAPSRIIAGHGTNSGESYRRVSG